MYVCMQYNTKYIYELGKGDAQRRFFFTTPPEVGPDAPYTFGVIGEFRIKAAFFFFFLE